MVICRQGPAERRGEDWQPLDYEPRHHLANEGTGAMHNGPFAVSNAAEADS
jgi:hypothetical protein